MIIHPEIKAAYDLFTNDNAISERTQQVIDIFNSCFGKKNVDVIKSENTIITKREMLEHLNFPEWNLGNMLEATKSLYPSFEIIVKFDKVTVTNELSASVDIYDLFIKITIKKDGTLFDWPTAKRSTFTLEQLNSAYIHSHVTSLEPSEQGLKAWHSMCFGTGPIVDTIYALRMADAEIGRWVAFITELRQWTRVESIDGGPYRKIESIHGGCIEVSSVLPNFGLINGELVKSYIRAKRLKVGFVNNKFCLGTTFTEWLIDFSAYAKAWAKENNKRIPLVDTLIKDNKIYIPDTNSARIRESEIQRLIGKPVLTFKGTVIPLALVEGDEQPEHMQLIPYAEGAGLLKSLLNKLNYLYGSTEEESKPAPIFW